MSAQTGRKQEQPEGHVTSADRRRKSLLIIGLPAAAALLLVFGANSIATFFTDLWWFQERGYRDVFMTVFVTRNGIGAAFTLVLALFIGLNLSLARRHRPTITPTTARQAKIQRLRDAADPYLPWAIAAVSVLFAFALTYVVHFVDAQWQTFLLFFNGAAVGVVDPLFSKDLGFWLFEYPLWTLLQAWVAGSLGATILLTAGAHLAFGAFRPKASEKITPAARTHLTVLVALAFAVRGWGYWLDRYELNYSRRGTVTGASFTSVNAELPALMMMVGVTAIVIVILLVSLRRGGFLLPVSALGLFIFASVVLQGVYPSVVQVTRVDRQELAYEREFIQRNLEATRRAYGLDDVARQTITIRNDLDEQDVRDNDVTLRNVRLWDPATLEATYMELQSLRPYYEFLDVAIDRYIIDGELRQVMLATRELSRLPQQGDTWQNRHITFTHGFGIVASDVNTADAEWRQPVFISANIPPVGDDAVVANVQPGIYFGLTRNPAYSLVRTDAAELDFEDPETQAQITTVYAGRGGVPIDSFSRRLAFALRFADYNLIGTDLLNDESRIIFNRQVADRVHLVAPFLELDSSPYPVVIDGRIKWIVDGYTTSTAYPYSERRALVLGNRAVAVNYVRNSVKAVVDAFDGDVTLYIVDDEDPIVAAWDRAFPGLLQPFGSVPEEIVRHFRYPQDLFRLQAQLFQTYHIPDAVAFYNRRDAWEIPADPAAAVNAGGMTALQQAAGQRRLQPYYLVMRLPGEETEEFVLIQPYLAANRPNMASWLAGRSDGGRLNELFAVQFPSDQLVLGPLQAQARIEQDREISVYIDIHSEAGRVIRGEMQVLPIADSILYIQPLFFENPRARIPELARVVVVMGEQVAFDRTLSGALDKLLDARAPGPIAAYEGDGE